MSGDVQDRWATLCAAVAGITHDRCNGMCEGISPNLDKLMQELLAAAYDLNNSTETVSRIARVVGIAYQLGRSNQYLYNTVLKGG